MVVFAVVFASIKLDFAYASRRKQSQLLDPLIKIAVVISMHQRLLVETVQTAGF
jgi:hypothetical protein